MAVNTAPLMESATDLMVLIAQLDVMQGKLELLPPLYHQTARGKEAAAWLTNARAQTQALLDQALATLSGAITANAFEDAVNEYLTEARNG